MPENVVKQDLYLTCKEENVSMEDMLVYITQKMVSQLIHLKPLIL